MASTSELTVEYVGAEGPEESRWWPEYRGVHLPVAWRVCVTIKGRPKPFPFAFARQRDADMAKVSLERKELCTVPSLLRAGRLAVEAAMLEPLGW